MMKVGFTGTRWGMTDAQKATLRELLAEKPDFEAFHHGDCQGADDEAANIVHDLRHCNPDSTYIRIIVHPGPDNDPCRTRNPHADETLPGKNHFARNRDIVDACDVLIACPHEMERQERGGTWYTIDYAAKKGRRTVVVYPDGTMKGTEEGSRRE